MSDVDRRRFLNVAARSVGAAAALSVLPPGIRRALSFPASNITGTIADVEHIVILMQENRSFDHYFGTLRGVRGLAIATRFRWPAGSPSGSNPMVCVR
jgi:phospholipase C